MKGILGTAFALMIGMPGIALAQSPRQPVVELGGHWRQTVFTSGRFQIFGVLDTGRNRVERSGPERIAQADDQTAGSTRPPASPAAPAAWPRLKPGREVWVTTNTGSLVHGKVAAISDSTLKIRQQSGEITIRLDDVRLVEGRDSLKNGLLIGAASGAVSGGVFFGLVSSVLCEDDSCLGTVLFGAASAAAVGGLLGLIVDGVIPGRQTLFGGNTIVVTPVMTPTGKAVNVAIRWR